MSGILSVLLTVVAVVAGIALAGVLVAVVGGVFAAKRIGRWAERNGLPEKAQRQLDGLRANETVRHLTGGPQYLYLETDGSASPARVLAVVRPLRGDPVVGRYAEAAIEGVGKAEFYREGLEQALERDFGVGSLTWDKFHAPVDEGLDALMADAARIANRIQVFDSQAYRDMQASEGILSDTERSQFETLQATLRDLDGIVAVDAEIVSKLESLHGELSKLSASRNEEEMSALLGELQRLSDETHLYS